MHKVPRHITIESNFDKFKATAKKHLLKLALYAMGIFTEVDRYCNNELRRANSFMFLVLVQILFTCKITLFVVLV